MSAAIVATRITNVGPHVVAWNTNKKPKIENAVKLNA
jgi:hypothetical protein